MNATHRPVRDPHQLTHTAVSDLDQLTTSRLKCVQEVCVQCGDVEAAVRVPPDASPIPTLEQAGLARADSQGGCTSS